MPARRLALLLTLLVLGCGRREPTAPIPPVSTASWSADTLQAGTEARLTVTVTAGPDGIPAGTPLRVGFPHWVYGSRDVQRPAGAESAAYGRWYVVEPLPALRPGEEHATAFSLRLPGTAGPFAPLAWLDWSPLPASPERAIEAGPAERLVVIGPSQVAPGASARIAARLEDSLGNPIATAVRSVEAPATPGVHRLPLTLEHDGPWSATTQPVLVQEPDPARPLVAWLDLHGHSALSDGRGTADAWFRAARDDQHLDGAALSDHDWQLDDAEWETLLSATDVANHSGTFVTVPAAEINVNGHEIAYFADLPRLSALPGKGSRDGARTIWEETDRGLPTARVPDLLGAYASSRSTPLEADLLVVTHTSLARGMGTGYPLQTPLPANRAFEIYSSHGSSECEACPRRVGGGPLEPDERVGSLWDALDSGLDATLIAASDAHDGRPATDNWGAFRGGLTAVEVPELTRAAVLQAIADGHAWATTGERTLLRVRWRDDAVDVLVVGEDVQAVEVVGDRAVVARREDVPQGTWFTLDGLPANAWRYVRVLLPDGARAWRGVWRADRTP